MNYFRKKKYFFFGGGGGGGSGRGNYCRFRLFWKYAEIGYFGRLKLFPFQGLTRVQFSLFSENNGFLNIYMLK